MNDELIKQFTFAVYEYMVIHSYSGEENITPPTVKEFPRRTGNLADNALQYAIMARNGKVYIDVSLAPYVEYLENGTEKSTAWVGFWENIVPKAVAYACKVIGGQLI